MTGYYEGRKHCEYYALVRDWLESYGEQESILDIGPADTPVASWGSFRYRFVIDPRMKPRIPHVVTVRGSWPDGAWRLPKRISVVTCLQVVEHVADVQPFVDAIFAAAMYRVLFSVPYMWRAGACKSHLHDPISRRKLRAWTQRQPIRTQLITEPDARVIEEYHGGAPL